MDYADYYWKNGVPCGIKEKMGQIDHPYKIVSDPYNKHISIEFYENGSVIPTVIYDSKLLDFRHLNEAEQMGWEKTSIPETNQCLIRDHHDRVAYIEEYEFKGDLCVACRVYSPHKILLSVNTIHYTKLGDAFNGIIFYDANHHPVMVKKYRFDDKNALFTDLLEENRSPLF